MPKLILVCGTSFAGKSTLARLFAKRFGAPIRLQACLARLAVGVACTGSLMPALRIRAEREEADPTISGDAAEDVIVHVHNSNIGAALPSSRGTRLGCGCLRDGHGARLATATLAICAFRYDARLTWRAVTRRGATSITAFHGVS